MNTLRKILIGVIAASALAGPAMAQTNQATATTAAAIQEAITVAAVENMDFGTIVKPSDGTTTVTLTRAGARSISGGAGAQLIGGATGTAAEFEVNGEGALGFSITTTHTELTDGTNTINWTPDAPATGALSSGTATFNVGGAFDIDSATVAGAYAGSVTVEVAYN